MNIRTLLIALVSVFSLSACAYLSAPCREARQADGLAQDKRYSEAAAAYRKVLRESPDSRAAADARFGLAVLLAYHDNPQRDYGQSLHEFEEFLRLSPEDKRAPEAQNWRQVLKALLEARKENERLNKNIEELKKLDIKHEEKRKRR